MSKKLTLKIPLSKRPHKAKRLLALRKRMNLSQREMARYFGVTTGAIMLWEKGDRALQGPSLKLLEIYEFLVGQGKLDTIREISR